MELNSLKGVKDSLSQAEYASASFRVMMVKLEMGEVGFIVFDIITVTKQMSIHLHGLLSTKDCTIVSIV